MSLVYRSTAGRRLTVSEGDLNIYQLSQASGQTFVQSGIAAANRASRTAQAKMGDIFHLKDAKNDDGTAYAGDGVQDDTTAVAAAIAGAASGTLIWTGTPRITSGLTISQGTHLFDGRTGINTSTRPGSYIVKDDTLDGVALTVSGAARLVGGGVVAEEGNGNVNIKIVGNSARWEGGYSENAGTHGWFIDGSSNSNHCTFIHCRSYGNTNHGFYLTGEDANAETFVNCFAQSNGGDGFFSEKTSASVVPAWNSFVACGGDTNAGYGINLKGGADNSIIGGDFEANTTGDINIQSTERRATLVGGNQSSVITDSGFLTRRLDRALSNTVAFTGAIRGASGTDKTATAVTISGSTATITSASHGYSNGDTIVQLAFSNANLNGAFVISNVDTDTYDITFRTDASVTVPTSETGLSAAVRKCGIYATNVCSYTIQDGQVFFDMHLVTSDVTNISGTVTLLLPFVSATVSNYFAAMTIGYMAGVTATNNVGVIIGSNSSVATMYEDISGTPGTPSQLQATGLAAATTLVVSGRYRIPTGTN